MSSVLEDYITEYGLTLLRPDTSGIRGKGVNRKTIQVGDSDFPYGKAQPNWGEPHAYDRSSKAGSMRAPVMTPKGLEPGDDRWSELEEMGIEGWTSGTPVQGNIVDNPPRSRSKFGIPDEAEEPWKDGTTEAMGVPFNSAKAGQGTGGQHTGGRVMPGTSGQWSSRPKGGQWDKFMDDDELTKHARQDEYNYGMAMNKNIGSRVQPRMTTDPDLEVPSAEAPDMVDEPMMMQLKFGGVKFGKGAGNAMKISRMQPGMSWKESVHRGMVEAFVSMADTPCGTPGPSKDVAGVDSDMTKQAFMMANGHAMKHIDNMSEADLISFLMKLDVEYFTKTLGKIGKSTLVDIYKQWVAEVLSKENDNIERMAERINVAAGIGDR